MGSKFTHLDLFSGIGGFALAARWSGIETIAFCEKNQFCQKVLAKHWPNKMIFNDIKTMIYTGEVDLLTASLPCQPFSIAGKKKGKDDDRYLWPDTIRIIKESKPKWILLENVPGIIPHLDPILEDLENENYTWWASLVPASLIGAPHKRERLWIVANANGKRCDSWIDNREKGSIQDDIERYIAQIQSEWPQFQPESWKTYEIEDWVRLNAFAPRKNNGLSLCVDRNRALGNAIVPQIAYIFMKSIMWIEENNHN